MKFRTKAGITLGVLVVGGGALTFGVSQSDQSWLRTRIIAQAERQTGHSVRIGDVRLWILPVPWVQLRDVSVGNLPGQGGPDLFHADEVRIRPSLSAIFSRKSDISDLSVSGGTLALHRYADGRGNWLVQPQAAASGGGQSGAPAARSSGADIRNIRISRVTVSWNDEKLHLTGRALVESLSSSASSGSSSSDLMFRVHSGEGVADGDGTIPLAYFLHRASDSAPFDLHVNFRQQGRTAGNGHISGNFAPFAVSIEMNLDSTDILSTLFPKMALPVGAKELSLSAAFDGDPKNLKIRSFRFSTGQIHTASVLPRSSVLSSEIEMSAPDSPVILKAQGAVSGIPLTLSGSTGSPQIFLTHGASSVDFPFDLSLMSSEQELHAKGNWNGHALSAKFDGSVSRFQTPDGHVTAEKPELAGQAELTLPFVKGNWFRTARGTFDLHSPAIHYDKATWNSVSAHITFADGYMSASPVRAAGPDVPQSVAIEGDVASFSPFILRPARLSASPLLLPADVILRALSQPPLVSGQLMLTGTIDLPSFPGAASLRDLTGHAGLSMVSGEFSGVHLPDILTQKLHLKGTLPLRCLGAHFTLADGRMDFDHLGLDSVRAALIGSGSFNIPDKASDFHFQAHVGAGSALVSSRISVRGVPGSLAVTPESGPDKVFTLTIGKASDEGDPCPAILSDAREGVAGPGPQTVYTPRGNKLQNIFRKLGLLDPG
ncbi:AsmA family protein [Acetobacter sp. AN02]|uniref:AsmA family protein n=1 Tax=Acetobacter sp. AN02 TaxID=2894186 RepID=UPI0024342096|nr:AsmA family protein [Acetobacter sp. AN02]MDG6094104.1 AsmA family protein [Acetobacter sp. AN02]